VDDPEFTEALETVLSDLRTQGVVLPQVRVDGESIMLHDPDGSGHGVFWLAEGTAGDRLASLADQVQEWAVEALWSAGEPAVWPHCPQHPDTHPLTATVAQDGAVWACPKSGAVVARIGELVTARPSAGRHRRAARRRTAAP
jgi:hypothetical protein